MGPMVDLRYQKKIMDRKIDQKFFTLKNTEKSNERKIGRSG